MKKIIVLGLVFGFLLAGIASARVFVWRWSLPDFNRIFNRGRISRMPTTAPTITSKPTQTPKPTNTSTPTPTPLITPIITPRPTPTLTPTSNEISFNAYITGYSWWDNDPPGSLEISNPVIHQGAGGTGTYQDPITMAVGLSNRKMQFAEGTIFYLPYLKRYFIVEDTCASCGKGYKGYKWLDVFVDGRTSKSGSNECMNALTDIHEVIQNPSPNYKVEAGAVYESGCVIN